MNHIIGNGDHYTQPYNEPKEPNTFVCCLCDEEPDNEFKTTFSTIHKEVCNECMENEIEDIYTLLLSEANINEQDNPFQCYQLQMELNQKHIKS